MGSRTRRRAAALIAGTLVGAIGLPLLATPAGAIDTRKPTTATIGTSFAAVLVGQPVTLTADVHATPPATGTPSASVQFVDGGGAGPVLASVPLSSGLASYTTSSLPAGSHDLIVRFAGGTAFQPADSAPINVLVAKANTTLNLTSNANPAVARQPITYTATVAAVAPASGTPSATISFYDGATLLGTAPTTGGVATLTTSAASQTVGSHSITASFPGGTNMLPSTGGLTQVVNKGSTTTTLHANPTAAVSGQGVTLTATVAPVAPSTGTPSATVTFKDGATVIGTAPTVGGVATLNVTTLQPGARSLTASFPGGTTYLASTSAAVPVNIGPAATTTALGSSAAWVVAGSPVTFTATVTPVAPGAGIPASTVTFRDGTTVLGTVALTGGSASLTTSSLASGDRNITATYNGGAKYTTSTSAVLVQTVSAVPDTNAPSISLSHPSDVGSWSHGATTVTIYSGDAESGLAGMPTCTVNGTPTTPSGTPGTATLSLSGDGTYAVSCTATDNSSNSSTGSDTVQIDGTAPTVSITHTPSNFFVNSSVEFTIALSDNLSGLNGANCNAVGSPISLTNDAGVLRGTYAVSSPGFHQVSCSASDVAGNGTGNADQVIIDVEAPQVAVVGVDDGTTYNTEPTPSCSASDNYGITTNPTLSVVAGVLPDEWVATCSGAVDLAGNVSGSASVSYFVVLDGGAPNIEVSHTANGNGWNGDAPVTVNISVSDPLPSSGLSQHPTCTVDGGAATVDGVSNPFTVTIYDEGTHAVACEITDDAGNTGYGSDTVKIDLTDPTATINGPSNGAVYSDGVGAPTATCDGSDDGSGVDVTVLIVTPTFPGTSYDVQCEVTDKAGRTASTSLVYGIDDRAPTLSITHDGDTAPGYHNGSSVDFIVTAIDEAPTTGFTADAACTDNGNPVSPVRTSGAGTSAVSGDYRVYTVTVSDEGSHSIHCEITDGTGRSASADDSVTLDHTAPAVSLTAPTVNFSYLNAGVVTLTATDNVGVDSVVCWDYSTEVPFTSTGDGSTWTLTPYEGDHSLFCDVSDATGNHSYASLYVTFDSIAPTTSVWSPIDGGVYTSSLFPGISCDSYDGGSGIANSGYDVTALGGGRYSATCTATDWADNSYTSAPVSWTIDDNAPTILLSYPQDGNGTWNVSAVVDLSLEVSDDNDVAALDCWVDGSYVSVNVSDTIQITYDGWGIYVSCSAEDDAGNWTAESIYVDHDTVAPDAYLYGPLDGWTYASLYDVPSITCDAYDATSGVFDYGSSTTTQIDALTWQATCSGATDWAGNVAGDVTVTYTVDAPAPDVTVSWVDSGYGWSNTSVSVDVSVYDYTSWGASADCFEGATYLGSDPGFTVSGEGVHDIDCYATDVNGNTGYGATTVQIDLTAPDVSVDGVIDGGSYSSGSEPTPSCSTSDDLSGVNLFADVYVTDNGDGSFTVECMGAEDWAGNSGYASATYDVLPVED